MVFIKARRRTRCVKEKRGTGCCHSYASSCHLLSLFTLMMCVCVTMYLLFCSETSESEDEDAEQLTTGLDLEITRTINRIR